MFFMEEHVYLYWYPSSKFFIPFWKKKIISKHIPKIPVDNEVSTPHILYY